MKQQIFVEEITEFVDYECDSDQTEVHISLRFIVNKSLIANIDNRFVLAKVIEQISIPKLLKKYEQKSQS